MFDNKPVLQQRNSCRNYFRGVRLPAFIILFMCFYEPASAQTTMKDSMAKYTQPTWWFGVAGGANFNFYSGTLQRANETTVFPSAFRKGNGTGLYAAPLMEYRMANSMLGFMLQIGADDRQGELELPNQRLMIHLGYISIEPSIRLSPRNSNFYLYGGPRFGFLATSDFTYKRDGFADYPDASANPDAKLYISSLRKNPVSMQIGAGYDIHLSRKGDKNQFVISPFATYFPTMWRKNIRTIERLYLNTARVGIALKVGTGRMITPAIPPAPIVKDRDGDGVPDLDDRCPDVFGLAARRGCPDRDGDSLADIDDKCPDVFGYARYEGCPVPDKDKDGINDELDKCPDIAGLARYQGCPIPDTDGDGVNDEEDKCITEKGPASNFGCPLIPMEIVRRVRIAAENIFFETGKAKLLPRSFPKLNDVVIILKENPSFKVQVDGHTDFVGTEENNQTLSEQRAESVKAYLESQGIPGDRLTAAGYGEIRPIADNNTTAGKAKNRRVEMTLRNY